MGYQQYLRKVSVTLEGAGKAIGFDPEPNQTTDHQLRIRFDVRQGDTSTPPSANIFIYNLSKPTYESIRKEYKTVTLEAGYEASSAVVFKGQILQVRLYRENITDVVTHIIAASYEQARNYATVNKTLAAGHTFKDRVDVATQAMKEFGVTVGHIDDLGTVKFPRSFSCFGMAKDMLRDICFATGTQWHIHNGVFNLVKNENTVPGDTVVLNGQKGLIGFPEQTLEGVVVRCLLNPRIAPAQKIQINQGSIQQAAFSASYLGQERDKALLGPEGILGLAADGIYKALLVEHNGDNRGPNWYTEIICVKNQGGESPALRQRGIYGDLVQGNTNAPGNNPGGTSPAATPAFSGGTFSPGNTNVGQGSAPGPFTNVGTLGGPQS